MTSDTNPDLTDQQIGDLERHLNNILYYLSTRPRLPDPAAKPLPPVNTAAHVKPNWDEEDAIKKAGTDALAEYRIMAEADAELMRKNEGEARVQQSEILTTAMRHDDNDAALLASRAQTISRNAPIASTPLIKRADKSNNKLEL